MQNYWQTIFLFSLVILSGCDPIENIFGDSSSLIVSEGQTLIEGTVNLPDDIDPSSISIISPVGIYEVKNDNTFKAVSAGLEKQILIAENGDGEVLLASLNASSDEVLNAVSTARAIVGMAPWSAFVNKDQMHDIIEEIALTDEFAAFENAVEEAINQGVSPLTDTNTLEHLQILFSESSLALKSSNLSESISSLPEVDYLVEPIINYSNGSLIIGNDGTTTAVWGVEVFKNDESLTGNLLLEGNVVKFPSLGNIWSFVTGDYTDMVFDKANSLEVPVIIEDKYKIQFGSPTRYSLNPDLSFEAARYNIYNSYQVIFNALGIELKGLTASEYFDQGCTNEIFNSTTNVLVSSLTKGELSATFFIDQVGQLFSGTAKSLSECADMFNNFPGSTATGVETYLKKLAGFLKAYDKLEAAFVTGKLVGDMLVLNDIEVCRQVIDGEIYPCFTLEKDPEIENKTFYKGEVKLEVKAQTDFTNSDNPIFPVGAPVHWVILNGDGTLKEDISYVNQNGIARVTLMTGDDYEYKVAAIVLNNKGEKQDLIEYEVKVEDLNYRLEIGNYHPAYENINVIYSYKSGDILVLPNNLKQMVRFTLNGQVVSDGLGGGWSQMTFGYYPETPEDIKDDNYKVHFYDKVNGREAMLTFKFTGSNAAYRKIVGNTLTIGKEGQDKGDMAKIVFSANGSFKFTYGDGSSSYTRNYSFYNVISHSYVNCNDYFITKPKIGCIRLSGGLSGGSPYPEWIMIYEDGTYSANSFYGCSGRYYSWEIF